MDGNGKVWVANYNGKSAMRIDPNAGPWSLNGTRIGAADLTVDLGDGSDHSPPYNLPAHPYTFSDMTGFVTLGVTYPSASWVFVHDGHAPGKNWTRLSWNGSTPRNIGIKVEVRAANSVTGPLSATFQAVSNGQSFNGVVGRYLEVRVTLWRHWTTASSPVLYDLTVYAPSS